MKQEHDYSGALEAFEAITDSLTLEDFVQGYSREIRAALTSAKGDGWLPIESAPKDGTPFDILLNGKSRIPDVHWSWKYSDGFEDKDFVEVGTGNPILQEDNLNKITHWMPLPKPPQDGGDDG